MHADGPVSSEPAPLSLRDVEVMSSPLREVTASRKLFDLVSLSDGPDGEAVSLSDLQAIFSPGHNPSPRITTPAPPAVASSPVPPRVDEPDGTTAPLPPVAFRRTPRRPPPPPTPSPSPAMPVSSSAIESIEPISSSALQPISSDSLQPISSGALQPISSGSILESTDDAEVDVDFSGADETRPSPGVEKATEAKATKPAHLPFFDVGSIPPLGAVDLYEAAPAPFDPSVPPLPPSVRLSEPPNSGLRDIRSLALEAEADEPAPRKDFDLFNLSGGLFDEAHGNLGPPDMHRLALPRARSTRPSAAPVSQRPIAPVLTPSSAPVVSERHPRVAAPGTSRRASRAALIIGLGALVALGAVGVSRLRSSAVDPPPSSPPVAETASLPALTVATPAPVVPTPPPTPTIAAVDPGVLADKSSPAALTASAPKPPPSTTPTTPTTPTREPAIEKPPALEKTVAAIEKPPPPVVEMPPPSGGAEFDKAAAKAALASAASRAAGCKPADDPGGGAKVSITFAPSGRVTTSRVTGPPYQGTTIGGCIAAAFRSASVPPFDGAPVTVARDVTLR